jgi:hypothetical protein
MSDPVLPVRDVRAFTSAIARRLSPRRAARRVRRLWRDYWDYQAGRAIAVILYVLDEGSLHRPRPRRMGVAPRFD